MRLIINKIMATVISGNQVKLNDGTVVNANTGGWYDGQQFWGGTLSAPGVINSLSDQPGAGGAVNPEVIAAQGNTEYIQQQQQNYWGNSNQNPPGFNVPSGSTGNISFTQAPTINLQQQQQELFDASGISNLSTQIDSLREEINFKKTEADKRRSEVNENPFLSESSRVGRIAKIDQALNDSLKTDEAKLNNLQSSIDSKRNEINEKLGLSVQQYNIDRAASQDNFNMFNQMLSSGMLANATPQDLANLAAQAGVPVSFIQSAINSSKTADVQIITETDNAGNVTILTIDKNTGEIVNQVSAGKVGKGTASSGGGGTTSSTITQFNNDAKTVSWSKETDDNGNVVNVSPFMKLVIKYASKMSLDEIYKYYLTSELGKTYGQPTENNELIVALYNQARGL